MGRLQWLLDSLSADPRVRGFEFELVCKWFLENDPRYSAELETVWLWKDWPDCWGRDAGIDLVACTRYEQLWAVQAKAYDPTYAVKKRDVDTFSSASSRSHFVYRLLIATTDQMDTNANGTFEGQEKKVVQLLLTLNLGTWVSNQKQQREHMLQDRRERLEALPGWTWDLLNSQWGEAFAVLTSYVAREGNVRVRAFHRDGEIKLGQWVGVQRKNSERMSQERRERLEALPGWVWRVGGPSI